MHSYEKNKMIGLLYRIFQAEEWKWYDSDVSPTFEEIDECVTNLENSAYAECGFASTGRITVKYNKEIDDFEYYLDLN